MAIEDAASCAMARGGIDLYESRQMTGPAVGSDPVPKPGLDLAARFREDANSGDTDMAAGIRKNA